MFLRTDRFLAKESWGQPRYFTLPIDSGDYFIWLLKAIIMPSEAHEWYMDMLDGQDQRSRLHL
jgi:hypothetical protein